MQERKQKTNQVMDELGYGETRRTSGSFINAVYSLSAVSSTYGVTHPCNDAHSLVKRYEMLQYVFNKTIELQTVNYAIILRKS